MQDSPTKRDRGEGSVLPERPYLKPWYRLTSSDGRLTLEYAHSAAVLEGKAVEKLLPVLLPLLDGTRTTEEINAYLGEEIEPAVTQALTLLADRRLLTDGPPLAEGTPAPAADSATFLAAVSRDRLTVAESEDALRSAQVSVVGSGAIASEIAKALRVAGLVELTLLDWAAPPDRLEALQLALVAPDPGEIPRLHEWNRRALGSRLPWLQVLPFDGRIAAVGPLYLPDETCCYECYLRRRAGNVAMRDEDYLALQEEPAAYPSTTPLQLMAAGLAGTLALQWLGERAAGQIASHVPATMHAIEWDETVKLSRHHVYRVPRCPVCFEDDRGTPSPWHG